MGIIDSVLSVVPGYKTIKATAKGLFEEGLTGAVKGLAKGLSQDWALGIACMLIPGAQPLAMAQLGCFAADMTGMLDLKSERQAQSYSSNQHQQVQSPGYW
jgi:hypothetical protein